jgi:hypothetical protein
MNLDAARMYVALCAVALVAAIVVAAIRRRTLVLLQSRYWRWLLVPWKLATFAVAATGLTLMAPYTHDPNWDHTIAIAMSLLTFATAPFAVGALWRRRDVMVATCVWLLSASWSFDWYWYARRGFYPDGWASNLLASSVLYLAAGVLWNLEFSFLRGVGFGFRDPHWPAERPASSFGRVAAPALALMAATGGTIAWAFLRS